MERKLAYILLMLVALVISSGCINQAPPASEPTGGQCLSPKKMIGNICCYDENNNGVCDMEDLGCPDSCDDNNSCTDDSCSGKTDFKCVHDMISPCCGNGVCEESEDINNVCPEDCMVLDVTDFALSSEKAYMVGNTFKFIHTVTADPQKHFFLNITAGSEDMQDIRYTFECNSSQNSDIDSINSEVVNVSDNLEEKINKFEDANYRIYTNFQDEKTGTFSRDVDVVKSGETVFFNFNIEKKDVKKRDDLSCLVHLYFIVPQKEIDKWLRISYI